MLAGPLFSREALTAPRQPKHFLARAGYVAALFVLMFTASQTIFGWQQVRNLGELARFGTLVFQLFSVVQLSLILFFSLLLAAGNVAQEKDRRTLILLLMTDLRNRELVLGKLSASLLMITVLLLTSAPAFAVVYLLGGVSLDQIGWVLLLCAASALAAGSWGSLVAFWREKTFQTLAIGVLGLVLFIGVVEALGGILGPVLPYGEMIALLNPYRGLGDILDPLRQTSETIAAPAVSIISLTTLAVLLNLTAITRLRVWNPSRFIYEGSKDNKVEVQRVREPRRVWSNPILWREIRTLAYGRKIFFIKLAYLLLAGYVAYVAVGLDPSERILGLITSQALAFTMLGLVSLLLINAQAVTALTGERDANTLELLLVTDISAREFIFGKLAGIFYNAKELVLGPLALAAYFCAWGFLSAENLIWLSVSFLVLCVFSAVLGLHSGLSFDSSRQAIGNSLGTMFFLFVGIFICMLLIAQARSSFALQLPSFLVFIVGGSLGLWSSLTHRNPSNALNLAAAILPFLTFYAITAYLLGGALDVCLAIAVPYGFATAAMLVPAVSAFDVALGRTTLDRG